jgi:hypothetical protein
MDPNMYGSTANPLLPYRLRSNYDGFCAGSDVKTDADGNRVIIPSYASLHVDLTSAPERTVLLLGDSVVFGFGLPDTDTMASQLQRVCATQQLNYEIRNIGVPGYTSWNEYAALADYLKQHQLTDVVLLYISNDLTFENDYPRIGRGAFASFSGKEDRLHRFLRVLCTHVYVADLLSDGVKRLADVKKQEQPSVGRFDAQRLQPAIDYSMQALREIQELCREKNIRFAVGIYRDMIYYDDKQNWLAYEQAIKSALDRAGIRSFLVKSHIEKLSVNQVRVHFNDPHPSKEATALIVGDVLDELKRILQGRSWRSKSSQCFRTEGEISDQRFEIRKSLAGRQGFEPR